MREQYNSRVTPEGCLESNWGDEVDDDEDREEDDKDDNDDDDDDEDDEDVGEADNTASNLPDRTAINKSRIRPNSSIPVGPPPTTTTRRMPAGFAKIEFMLEADNNIACKL